MKDEEEEEEEWNGFSSDEKEREGFNRAGHFSRLFLDRGRRWGGRIEWVFVEPKGLRRAESDGWLSS